MMFIETFFDINDSVPEESGTNECRTHARTHTHTFTQHDILLSPFFFVTQISPNIFP
jgi:hypothetical protein